MEMLSTKQKTAIVIAGVIVVGIFIFYMSTKTKTYDYSAVNETIQEKVDEEETKESEEPEEIVIHISGAVQNEGIVRLANGARAADAIEKAGGLTSEADLTSVNLAYVLKDGQKIYVPRVIDTEEDRQANRQQPESTFIENPTKENSKGKVNINTATMDEIASLSGIGEKTAIKIITYRETNGRFKTIEEIKNVSGIGDAKYENIKSYICVN